MYRNFGNEIHQKDHLITQTVFSKTAKITQRMSNVQTLTTFNYTDRFIGILTMSYHNQKKKLARISPPKGIHNQGAVSPLVSLLTAAKPMKVVLQQVLYLWWPAADAIAAPEGPIVGGSSPVTPNRGAPTYKNVTMLIFLVNYWLNPKIWGPGVTCWGYDPISMIWGTTST